MVKIWGGGGAKVKTYLGRPTEIFGGPWPPCPPPPPLQLPHPLRSIKLQLMCGTVHSLVSKIMHFVQYSKTDSDFRVYFTKPLQGQGCRSTEGQISVQIFNEHCDATRPSNNNIVICRDSSNILGDSCNILGGSFALAVLIM